VCGYGSDLVAVLGLLPGGGVQWEGAIRVPPKQVYPRGTGRARASSIRKGSGSTST
jgi:hypothetical protein